MSRKKERENALKCIFQLDFHDGHNDYRDSIDYFIENEGFDLGYGSKIVAKTEENLDKIDDILNDFLKKTWKIDRIPKMEKSILRLSICELMFMDDPIPFEIIINEAVELTKKYGEEDGKNYVNGILNKIVKDVLNEKP
ncbi:MAG: transcription antitermination factor NusB [Eubacteriaceae bacterium]